MPDNIVPDSILLTQVSSIIGAIAGLGTAAFGLVDASKAIRGGVSNYGFDSIRKALSPFASALGAIGGASPWDTLYANWLNGMAKADQKAVAKSLIRLGLTPQNAATLADALRVDPAALTSVASKINLGTALEQQDMNILGQFDAMISAILDAGYERADQQYRNKSKLWAMIVAIVLAVVGGGVIYYENPNADGLSGYIFSRGFLFALLVGAVSTPLAPMAKDLTSALTAAVKAVAPVRR
jgi:hypothetical protein